MLVNSLVRLKRVLEQDGGLLKATALEVNGLEKEDLERKFGFVKVMDGLNDELGDALRRFEECGLESLLSVAVCGVVETFVLDKLQAFDHQNHNGDHAHAHGEQREQWEQVLNLIRDAAERLNNASTVYAQDKETHDAIANKAFELRNSVQHLNTEALGDAELDELERLWEQSYEMTTTTTTTTAYDCDDGHGLDDGNGGAGAGAGGDGGSFVLQQQQQQQPVNMHLFYGDEMIGASGGATDDGMEMEQDADVAAGHDGYYTYANQ